MKMMVNLNSLRTLCSLFFIGVESSYWESDPVKYGPASHTREVQIHSRHGHYLSINDKGEVKAVWDPKSPNVILEMSSYGKLYKRIRKPGSWYLAIDKDGKIRTRMKKTKDSLFRERHNGSWMSYTNDQNSFMLAFGKNGQPRHGVKSHDIMGHKTRTQFLVIPMCGPVRCDPAIQNKRKRFAGGRRR